jgi:hypothetical protein
VAPGRTVQVYLVGSWGLVILYVFFQNYINRISIVLILYPINSEIELLLDKHLKKIPITIYDYFGLSFI